MFADPFTGRAGLGRGEEVLGRAAASGGPVDTEALRLRLQALPHVQLRRPGPTTAGRRSGTARGGPDRRRQPARVARAVPARPLQHAGQPVRDLARGHTGLAPAGSRALADTRAGVPGAYGAPAGQGVRELQLVVREPGIPPRARRSASACDSRTPGSAPSPRRCRATARSTARRAHRKSSTCWGGGRCFATITASGVASMLCPTSTPSPT